MRQVVAEQPGFFRRPLTRDWQSVARHVANFGNWSPIISNLSATSLLMTTFDKSLRTTIVNLRSTGGIKCLPDVLVFVVKISTILSTQLHKTSDVEEERWYLRWYRGTCRCYCTCMYSALWLRTNEADYSIAVPSQN